MKSPVVLLALILAALPALTHAAPSQPPTNTRNASDPESALALQVAEIASSTKLSPTAKQRRIADVVRQAVLTATAKVQDPEQAVSIAVTLATAAARAAPEFTALIINSVVSIPSIASVDGAMGAVQSAVVAAASPDTQAGGGDNAGGTGDRGGNDGGNGGRGERYVPQPPAGGNGGGIVTGSVSQ